LRALKKRIRYMARLVVKRYLEDFSESSESILEKMLRSAKEVYDVDELTRDYLVTWLARVVAEDLRSAVEDAERDRLLYRQFQVVYDNASWGPVNIAKTITVYSAGLQASMTYVPSFSSPELLFLLELVNISLEKLNEIYNTVDTMATKGNGPLNKEIKVTLNGLKKAVEELKSIKEFAGLEGKLQRFSIPLSEAELDAEWEKFRSYAPEWLNKAWNAYNLLRHLKDLHITPRSAKSDKNLLLLLAWRLYELYVTELLIDTLRDLGYVIDRKSENTMVSGNLEILLNKQLDNSRLLSADSNEEAAKMARGRPDISLRNGDRLLIVECKFSSSPTYLTAGRFKAMAYLYEYRGNIAVLAFPELNENLFYDEEDKGTARLWDLIMNDNGTVKLRLSDGTAQELYLIKIDPAEGSNPWEAWENAKKRIKIVLENFLNPKPSSSSQVPIIASLTHF
jgi:hypothetical protein